MTDIKAINIPEPCHQSWQQMTEVTNGRHCDHCRKTVVDFTSMSNEEIIAHLSNSSHVCGRFGQQQVNTINYHLYAENLPKVNWWKRAAVVVGMLSPFLYFKASAQVKPTVVNIGDTTRNANKGNVTVGKIAVNRSVIVTGQIVAKDDGLPIPGVTVKLKGTNNITMTNADGKFTISVPTSGSSLVISYIGYTSQMVSVPANLDKPLSIAMLSAQSLIGEVVIVKTKTVPKFKKAWHRFKGCFGEVRTELAADSVITRSPYF